MSQTLHSPESLRALASGIFACAGWSAVDAASTADHLVLANLSGHDSHGVGMIPAYIQSWREGLLSPSARPATLVDTPPFLAIDAHVGLGQPAAKAAMARAIAVTRESGVCVLNMVNAHHIGRIGHYAEMAVEAGFIGMFWVNVAGRPPVVAPFGARQSRFGTNPHAIGVPNGDEPLILDFATSRMAHGKARVAFNRGEAVPPGYLIDSKGEPTTDPGVVQGERLGALLPFGDHKGAGIALMAEVLSAALVGPGSIVPDTPTRAWIINNLFAIVLDPARLDPDEARRAGKIAAIARHQRHAAPAAGIDHVRSPGDKERETRVLRRRHGVPVDDETWRQLMAAAEAVGFTPDA